MTARQRPEERLTDTERFLTDEFCKLWYVLKKADAELEAYKAAFASLQKIDQPMAEALNAYVVSQRHSSVLHKKMKEKYSVILETLLRTLHRRRPQTSPV